MNSPNLQHSITDSVEDYSVLLLDRKGNISRSNKGTFKIKGYSEEEIIGNNIRIFYPSETEENDWPGHLLAEARKNGKVHDEGWRVRKDGTTFWADVVITALYDKKNKLTGYSKITKDITEKHKQEEFEKRNMCALINNTRDIIWSIDRDYRLITSNKLFDEVYKRVNGSSIAKGDDILAKVTDKELLARWGDYYRRALSGEAFSVMEHTTHPVEKWSEVSFYPIFEDGTVDGAACYSHDVTSLKIAKQKVVNVNRLYAFISEINKAIVRAADAQSIYDSACKIATKIGKLRMAWIGLLSDENKKIDLVAQSEMPDDDKQRFVAAKLMKNGAQQAVVSCGRYYVCNNLEKDFTVPDWVAWGISRGIRSFMVLPIKIAGKVIGTFNLYAPEINFFTEEEIKLLESATEDISFAIDVYENEKIKKEAERKLQHSERRLKQAQEIAHIGNWERDFSSGVAIWSDEHCRIFGILPSDNLQTFESWLSFIHPDDLSRVRARFKDALKSLKSAFYNYRIVRGDGSIRHIYSECHFEINKAGEAKGSYGIIHDITDQVVSEEKLVNANQLYAFRSELSLTIVRATEEQTLFNDVCRIAVEIGKFDFVWVGAVDPVRRTVNLIAQCNATLSDLYLFDDLKFLENGPTDTVLKRGGYCVVDNFNCGNIPEPIVLYARNKGFESGLAIPIKNNEALIYTLNLFSTKPNYFDSEKILLVEQTARDISYAVDAIENEKLKKQALTKLTHSELRLNQAQQIAHFGSWEIDFATGVSTWSEEALRIYGLPTDNPHHTFDEWIAFIHPEDADRVKAIVEESNRTLNNSSYFHRIVRNDGIVRHVHSQANFEFNEDGAPKGMYGVVHDVTEIKEAELALKQSKNNLRYIIDLLPQAIFAVEGDGTFIFANSSFAWLYGLERHELVCNNITEIVPQKNNIEIFLQQNMEVLNTGVAKIIPEQKFIDYLGRVRMFHSTKVPYTMPGTNIKAVLGILTDITEQKQAEAEKTKIVADVIQRNKDLEQFSYIVSHNLRAPVANIIGLCDLLQLTGYETEDKHAMTSGLSASVKKLDTVIKDLNYILQIKNQLSEKREKVILSDLLSDIMFSIENMLTRERVKIISDFSAIDELFTIKSYLYSIFFNLITNSIKYRRPDVQPVIEISSRINGDNVELIFSDNGLGIDLDKMGKYVFGLYKRFHNHAEGKGMGLYIVKTQVETLGGKISITSEVNKGTTFTITFSHN